MHYLALVIPGLQGPLQAPRGVPTGGMEILNKYAPNAMIIVFSLAFLLAFIMLLYSGIQWIMSQGDKQKVMAARARIIYSIVGLVIILTAFGILQIIATAFHVRFFGV